MDQTSSIGIENILPGLFADSNVNIVQSSGAGNGRILVKGFFFLSFHYRSFPDYFEIWLFADGLSHFLQIALLQFTHLRIKK